MVMEMSTCKDCKFFDPCIYNREEDSPTCNLFERKKDLVEVVRCKDCKYWGGATYGYVCNAWSGINTKNYTKPDGFCSYGERKMRENEKDT